MAGNAASQATPVRCTAPANARQLARWAYAALLLGLALYVVTIWAEVIIDTHKLAAPTSDLVAESHRHWRLRTTLLFLLWSILGLITTPLTIGWFVLVPAYLWYAYRVIRGAVAFSRGHPIGAGYVKRARHMMQSEQP